MSTACVFVRVAILAVLIFSTTEALTAPSSSVSRGFVVVPGAAAGRALSAERHRRIQQTSLRFGTIPILRLRSATDDGNENESTNSVAEEAGDGGNEKSLLDKVNDFLDTPILDANNRSNQGAVAETLKEFVRDEPEIAQVTFSVVVVAIMVLVTRIATSL